MAQDIEDPKLGVAWRRDERTGLVTHQVPRQGSRASQAWPIVDSGYLPYVAGRSYPAYPAATLGAGLAAAGPLVRLIPMVVRQRCVVDQISTRVTTLQAGTNYQLAIYANDYATQRPTGLPLGTTGDASSAGTAQRNTALTAAVTLDPGVYWIAHNTDATTAVWQVSLASGILLSGLIGGAEASVSAGTAQSLTGLSTAGAFRTWGDLTGASFTEETTGAMFFAFYRVSALA